MKKTILIFLTTVLLILGLTSCDNNNNARSKNTNNSNIELETTDTSFDFSNEFIEKEDTLYYINDSGLYSACYGKENQLDFEKISFFTTNGEIIFYTKFSEEKTTAAGVINKYDLYSINTDGTEKRKILTFNDCGQPLCEKDGIIYYIDSNINGEDQVYSNYSMELFSYNIKTEEKSVIYDKLNSNQLTVEYSNEKIYMFTSDYGLACYDINNRKIDEIEFNRNNYPSSLKKIDNEIYCVCYEFDRNDLISDHTPERIGFSDYKINVFRIDSTNKSELIYQKEDFINFSGTLQIINENNLIFSENTEIKINEDGYTQTDSGIKHYIIDINTNSKYKIPEIEGTNIITFRYRNELLLHKYTSQLFLWDINNHNYTTIDTGIDLRENIYVLDGYLYNLDDKSCEIVKIE